MRAREGDLIRTKEGIIFDVKGLIHPPCKVIAFPRFIPNLAGTRKHGHVAYEKIYALSTRFEFLQQNYPHYIVYNAVFDERLCEIRIENITKHYKPIERLQELRHARQLDKLEQHATEFLEQLKTAGDILWNSMGISGSLLVKLHTPKSDIDPTIYGTRNCLKVHEALKALQQDSKSTIKPYSSEELKTLYDFRFQDTHAPFEDFVRTESRKVLQGKFKNRDYFMRLVKDWKENSEKYGEIMYENAGYARIEAEIEDDSEAIFTPCNYKLSKAEILEGNHSHSVEEIASFRGRFCEQARTGETVIAQGKVEKVTDCRHNREYFRLLIGNKPSDFMVLA